MIGPEDLIPNEDYRRVRPERLARIMALRAARRVEIGPWVSAAFENRETVLHQIQEMLLIENLSSRREVAHELETYAELLPGPGELSATLFIEIDDARARQEALRRLVGVERAVRLRLGEALSQAEDKRPIEARFARPQASAVYYLRFPLSNAALEGLRDGREPWLEILHPDYRHAAALSPALVAQLAREV